MFCLGLSLHGALKTERCSGLDALSVPRSVQDRPIAEPKKCGIAKDWMHGSSPRFVPDRPCVQP